MPRKKTIEIPQPGELALPLETSLQKLPSDAVHNHLHQVSERAKEARTQLENVEIASLILCAVELEHIKGESDLRGGLPWKRWVSENCDFSYDTARRYNKVLKAARLGSIEGLHPEAIPEVAPSNMSKDDLQDACNTLADSLSGLGGIRQLYLQLEIIALPSDTIDKNQNKKGGKAKTKTGSGDAEKDLEIDAADAKEHYHELLQKLDQGIRANHHIALNPADKQGVIDSITEHLDTLKSL